MHGLFYKLKNQNISIFEDNVKFMGDLPFSIYFDVETTCEKKSMKLRKQFPIPNYPIPFNHCINPDRKFVVRTFNHTFEQLNEVSYLSNEMLEFFDPVAAKQLRD